MCLNPVMITSTIIVQCVNDLMILNVKFYRQNKVSSY